jgi:hypothetical protein
MQSIIDQSNSADCLVVHHSFASTSTGQYINPFKLSLIWFLDYAVGMASTSGDYFVLVAFIKGYSFFLAKKG